MRLLLVLTGGALGSGGRYLVGTMMAERFGATFPWGTLLVNVSGAFAIGLLATMADEHGLIGAQVRLFLIVGVLGGFTTFSSFALEIVRLGEGTVPLRSLAYLAASIVFGLTAAILGVAAGRTFPH